MSVRHGCPSLCEPSTGRDCVRFCNGPCVKSPGWSCRWLLASVRGQLKALPHHTVRGSGEPIFPASSDRQRLRTFRLHPLHRPSGGTTGRRGCRPDLSSSSPHATGLASLVQRKSVPSTHMRWRMTPSLRAGATRAFFAPRRLATAIAQLLRGDMRTVRVSITLAAS